MVTAKKVTGRASSMPGGLAVGAAVSMIITVIVSAVSAHLISSELIGQDKIGYCAILALITASIAGARTAEKRIKRQRLLVCALSGLVYYCLLLALTALFFGGQYKGMGVTFIVVLMGSTTTVLMGNREGKRKYSYKHKK